MSVKAMLDELGLKYWVKRCKNGVLVYNVRTETQQICITLGKNVAKVIA